MKKLFLAWAIFLAATVPCWAQEHGAAAPSHESTPSAGHAADESPHPNVPAHPVWVRPVVMVIAVMFLLAWPIGALVRALAPEEVPATHAHDEHHGHKDPHGDTHGHDPQGHSAHH